MRHFLLSVSLSSLVMLMPLSLRAEHPVPAVYTVGNVDGISAGDTAELNLQESNIVIHSGKTDIAIPYSRIQTAELGARLKPVHKGLKLHKDPERRVLTIEFAESSLVSSDGKTVAKIDDTPKTIGLEMEASESEDALFTIEERSGKRRRTNGDAWWGDSAWKTNQNGQAVKPDSLGKLGN